MHANSIPTVNPTTHVCEVLIYIAAVSNSLGKSFKKKSEGGCSNEVVWLSSFTMYTC